MGARHLMNRGDSQAAQGADERIAVAAILLDGMGRDVGGSVLVLESLERFA